MKKSRVRVPTSSNIRAESNAWVAKMVAIAFVISLVFAFISTGVLPLLSLWIEVLLLLIFILIGVVFDTIGVAVAASSQEAFHSMNSRQVRGARRSLWLVRNSEKVSNFCSDVIGDVCGIVSGGATALIVATIISQGHQHTTWFLLIGTATVSVITITGKALGKTVALRHSNQIVYQVALFLCLFAREKRKP